MEHVEILSQMLEPLAAWYFGHARALPWREDPAPYRVWLSEIMLQQTRVAAVMPYFHRFLQALPTVEALANAGEEELMKLWQGLGYYSRARNLQRAARIIMEEHGGRIPEGFEELLSLPGIGRYTAAAISSIAYGHSHPAVDGNVLRVVARLALYGEDIRKESAKREVEAALRCVYPSEGAPGRAGAGILNQALMELGATVCLPNGAPLCGGCPLSGLCLARQAGRIEEYPQKSKAKPRRVEQMTVLRMEQNGAVALDKRGPKGLLAGLWELPHLEGHLSRKALLSFLEDQGIRPQKAERMADAVHVFSHVEWHMQAWLILLSERWMVAEERCFQDAFPGIVWAMPEEIDRNYSIPAAFRYFLGDLGRRMPEKMDYCTVRSGSCIAKQTVGT